MSVNGTAIDDGAKDLCFGEIVRGILLREQNTADMAKTTQAMPGPDTWIATQFEVEWMAQSARDARDWKLAGFLAHWHSR